MENVKEIFVEEFKIGTDKILITNKLSNENDNIRKIKCFKNMEEIITIEARKFNIVKIHKSVFLNLINLQNIDLQNNNIQKISHSFSNLKNLKSLKLDFNHIIYIPNFIGDFEKLEIFTITNNKINRLPSSIHNLQKLKFLKISYNMIEVLPIEFGLLKSIETLYIDANNFTEIPTTLCYLKHLSELSFEWLEFLDPPFQKVIKENIGKTIITLIRNSLQEMIKQNILHCDFLTFLDKNSINTPRKEFNNCNLLNKNLNNNYNKVINILNNFDSIKLNNVINDNTNNCNDLCINLNLDGIPIEDNKIRKINSVKENLSSTDTCEANLLSFSNLRNMKIFYAIHNNYFGVFKAILKSNADLIKIRNIDNKTPLYFAIHNNKIEIINLILTKVNLKNISNSYIYLHKAIRMRDPSLLLKLIDLGVDPNQQDDQGNRNKHYFLI